MLKKDLSEGDSIAMTYTPDDYLLCYKIYLTDSELILYYYNSDTEFVKESHSYSEVLETGFFVTDEGEVYYRYTDGNCAKGLIKVDGEIYYFDSYGCMVYGYKKISGKRYYFGIETGAAQYGGLILGVIHSVSWKTEKWRKA